MEPENSSPECPENEKDEKKKKEEEGRREGRRGRTGGGHINRAEAEAEAGPEATAKDQIRDNAPAGSRRSINLDVEGDNSNTETRNQSHGVKEAGQKGDAPKTIDQNNKDDLQVWKDRYLRKNEDPSRRGAKTGGMSAPKEITFKYRRTHLECADPEFQILDPGSEKT
ncbi:hypothetical protein CsSME_00054039 [Camellia sinensis var. sinensis]|uniref:Uncharacterized protein n=1 Tax=Camellia sinensis TaxID=4442 RepID=A0A7J7G1J1_CAMSI|nr:hypothetical protein HYC85_030700 [Camellia sinensis]